ncbi:hypothetical protein DPMN_040794 [Dreissena polymorpha]|uniref:Neurotransmitter-gated ion-channel transmembrane domain-containing protein n=1 Tax=Dreissena polymorpha TaxID=45954 RepID=A0A9D4CWP7_DREPO|nr:hypothetical protein DPMN_040794 [Dreissena polymorpha]
MKNESNGPNLDRYKPNSAWEIIDSSWNIAEDPNDYDSTIRFSLTIRRKPLYYIFSVIIPIMTLAILNFCIFLLLNESGEKAGYFVTVFLAFTVFLTIVSSSLPQNSDSVALISVFLIYSFDENVAIPRILVSLMRCLKRKSCSKESRIETTEQCTTERRMSDESSNGKVKYSRIEVVNFLALCSQNIFCNRKSILLVIENGFPL